MKHKHRIKPGYEGGEYCEGNVVELSVIQHAMWHYAEWTRKRNWQDELAWRCLSGQTNFGEAERVKFQEGGRMASSIVHSEKDEDGKSVHAKRMAASRRKLEDGRTAICVDNMRRCNEVIHAEKDGWGRSVYSTKNNFGERSRPIVTHCIATGEELEFPSISVACKILDLQQSHVSGVLSGDRKTHKGYTFRDKED